MVSPQVSTFASLALLSTCVAGVIRLSVLRLSSIYPSVVFFFASEFAIVTASEMVGQTTRLYAQLFAFLVVFECFAVGFVLRQLYSAVFARYRGIEILGRWCIYAAITLSFVLAIAGAASTGRLMMQRRGMILALEYASGCIIFGSVLLVGFILLAISRYPLALHRNVIINCRFFAFFMLVEAVALLTERFTRARYTPSVSVVEIFVSAIILLVWPLLLSREGEVTVLKLRRGINTGEETRLLGQLNAFNSLLLRVARK